MEECSKLMKSLVNTSTVSPFEGEKFFFSGDLSQQLRAAAIAVDLSIVIEKTGGLIFLTSNEDFKKVTNHIVSNQIDGWWHYVTDEEYSRIMETYYFKDEYRNQIEKITNIAKDLQISIYTNRKYGGALLYVKSKEEYDKIIEGLK